MNALDGYRSSTFDDAVAPDGSVRAAARTAMDAVLAHDLDALARAVRDEIDGRGIRFESVDGDDTLARRPGAARDRRRRLGAGRGRPRPARARRSTRSSPTSTGSGGSSPRACCRSGCSTARRTSSPRCWARPARRRLDRDRRARHRARRRGRVARARGQRAHAERPRLLGAAREAICGSSGSTAGPIPLDGVPAALRRVFGDGNAVVLTDGPDNSAYWEHDWIARQARDPARDARRPRAARRPPAARRRDGRRDLPAHERRRGRLRRRRAAHAGAAGRRDQAGQLLRDRRRRRQARARLRRRA